MLGWFRAGGRPGLLLETLQARRIRRRLRRQHLDRHLATESRVPRAVHLPHPARAERREDLVRTQARPAATRSLHAIDEKEVGADPE